MLPHFLAVTSDRAIGLEAARLYLISDIPGLDRAPLEEIDILQLRDKHATGPELRRAADRARAACDAAGTLFIVNDDPRLAAACRADGVHIGQDDGPVAAAREIVGGDRLIGLSTHSPDQIDDAGGVDYIGVGPIFATPTKPGHPPVGLELVRYAAAHARVPFFAIGGIHPENVRAIRAAGTERITVIRAIGDARDPAAAARALREVHVGAT
jgi:thiamine-phosphate pyrophosphorylase